jgi:hypothetical protein
VFLISVALFGIWVNLADHALGTARRMGPGYMPMLALGLLLLLGAIVLINSFFSGPDPLEKWTSQDAVTLGLAIGVSLLSYPLISSVRALQMNYYALGIAMSLGLLVLAISPGWRKLALILCGMTVFGLLLEQGGLLLSLSATIAISAIADKAHRPVGVAGLIVFLCTLSWWVFVKELDIRIPVWPMF